jgi:hypothetical protein
MKQKNQYSGQDFSRGNFECPDCGNKIPLDFRRLFGGGKVECTCGLILRVNLEKSRETIAAIKGSQEEISRATKGQFQPL